MRSGKRPLLEEVLPRQPERVDPELRQPRQELDPRNASQMRRAPEDIRPIS